MVVLALGEVGEAPHELDRGREALELQLALERVVDLGPTGGDVHAGDYDAFLAARALPQGAAGDGARVRARLPAARAPRRARAAAPARAAARSRSLRGVRGA